MLKNCITLILTALIGCSPKEQHVHEDPVERQSKCTTLRDDLIIYNTAAGFQLSRPIWMLNLALEDTFTEDCKLTSTKLPFALVHGALIPVPNRGIAHRNQPGLPQHYDEFTLMFAFQDPRADGSGIPERACKAAKNIYRLPKLGVQMCGEGSSPNITTLPFYPRFELINSRSGNPSMTCPHEDIEGKTIAGIQELTVKHSCRGYWTWRPGAHAMFDLGSGEVLKKFKPAIEAAESTLNSWVVKN